MIKLFLNIHFIKKHPSKVKFSISKSKILKCHEYNFFELRQMVTELQISKVTRIFEFHSKSDISRKKRRKIHEYMNIFKDVGITEICSKNFRKQFSHRVLSKNQEKIKVHTSEGFLGVNPPSKVH